MDDTFIKSVELPPATPQQADIFYSKNIIIVKARHIFSHERAFNCYQFIVPISKFPPVIVDKKNRKIETNMIFPINPDQSIIAFPEKKKYYYTPIFIDKKFLQKVCRSMLKKNTVSFSNKSFRLNSYFLSSIQQFTSESSKAQTGYEFILQSLGMQVAINLLRCGDTDSVLKYDKNIKTSKKSIKKLQDFLMENYQKDFSLDEIANLVNYSPYHLIRLFKSETGKTPFQYFIDIKIKKAKQLLKNTTLSITEISYQCGFNNSSHFSTTFKKHVGVSPLKYQKTFN